ncbi:hypothetical protein ACTMS8_08960 [Streptococcus suis]|uniref:hypothetical protein n=1 Tax=Streptococcus suis TaxID=1307 RepID=UPI003F896CBB
MALSSVVYSNSAAIRMVSDLFTVPFALSGSLSLVDNDSLTEVLTNSDALADSLLLTEEEALADSLLLTEEEVLADSLPLTEEEALTDSLPLAEEEALTDSLPLAETMRSMDWLTFDDGDKSVEISR